MPSEFSTETFVVNIIQMVFQKVLPITMDRMRRSPKRGQISPLKTNRLSTLKNILTAPISFT